MNDVHILKAQTGGTWVKSTCIHIDRQVSDRATNDDYEAQATALHDALRGSLPGAIYDRLLIRMLERTKSSLIVTRV